MTNIKKIFPRVILLGFIIALIIFAYWELPNTFFQQDEWQGFAENIYYQSLGVAGIFNHFLPSDAISHFNPLSVLFGIIEFLLLYINFNLYAWQSIIVHILNACLVYYFVYNFLKSRKIAFIAALFFGVNSIPSQAVTWVATVSSYEIPTAFVILSLIFFNKFIVQKEHKKRNLLSSLTTLFISLLFHEIGIFLFVFYPIVFFLYVKDGWKKMLPTFLYGMILLLSIFFLIRAPFFFISSLHSVPTVTDISRPSISVYPYRIISISFKSFADSFFPEKTLINISDQVIRLAYPQFVAIDNAPNPYVSQLIVFDLVSYILTFILLCFLFLISRMIKEKEIREGLISSIIFVSTSLLPYAFVSGKAGYASILEPKFFYISSIGTSVIIAITFYYILVKFSKSWVRKFIIFLILVSYFIIHMNAIKINVEKLVKMSIPIKSFLTIIKSSYSKLPQSVIFYTMSNKAYYGMPDDEKTLPVEIGFGQMLMVWYQADEKFPGCFYKDAFFLDILTQGYRTCDGRGFGYFRNYDKLISAVRQNKVPVEDIIAYSWTDETKDFKDITKTVRLRVIQSLQSENGIKK